MEEAPRRSRSASLPRRSRLLRARSRLASAALSGSPAGPAAEAGGRGVAPPRRPTEATTRAPQPTHARGRPSPRSPPVDFALVGQGLELLMLRPRLLRRRRHALLEVPRALDRRRRRRAAAWASSPPAPRRRLLCAAAAATRRWRRRRRRPPGSTTGPWPRGRRSVRPCAPARRRKAGRRVAPAGADSRAGSSVHRHVLRARWRLLVLAVRLLEEQLVVVVRRRRRRRVVGIAVGLHRCRRSTHDKSAVVVRARFEYSALLQPSFGALCLSATAASERSSAAIALLECSLRAVCETRKLSTRDAALWCRAHLASALQVARVATGARAKLCRHHYHLPSQLELPREARCARRGCGSQGLGGRPVVAGELRVE